MTGIFIITYNTPSDVFLCQMEAIKKFCKDDEYQIEIFDNSSDGKVNEDIKYHAERLGVKYRECIVGSLDPSRSHACAANMALFATKHLYDEFLFLDHDCIPIKDFSVKDRLLYKVGAGIGQGKKKTYLWPGCLFFSKEIVELIDFSPSGEFGLDTGGNIYKTIEEIGVEQFSFLEEKYVQNEEYNGKYNFYSIIDNTFMHFINTSNWNKQEDNEQRINSLLGIAKNYINGKDIGIS